MNSTLDLYLFSIDLMTDPKSRIQYAQMYCKDRAHKNVLIQKALNPYFYFVFEKRIDTSGEDAQQDANSRRQYVSCDDVQHYQEWCEKHLKTLRSKLNIRDFVFTATDDVKNFFGYSNTRFRACKVSACNRGSLFEFKNAMQKLDMIEMITISTKSNAKSVSVKCEVPITVTTFESSIDPLVQFIHDSGIKSCSWFSIDSNAFTVHRDTKTSTTALVDYELELSDFSSITIREDLNNKLMPRLVIASFDIETTSYEVTKFPNHENPMDQIVQISVTLGWDGVIKKRLLFALNGGWQNCYDKSLGEFDGLYDKDSDEGAHSDNDGVTLKIYEQESEYAMLLEFFMIMLYENPDVLTGYNIFMFDEVYIFGRCKYLSESHNDSTLLELSHRLGKYIKHAQLLKDKKMHSSAAGNNTYKYLDSKGLLHVDAQVMIDKDFKPETKSLDYVSSLFIQQGITSVERIESTDDIVDVVLNVKRDKHNSITLLEEGSYVKLMDQYNFQVIPKAKIHKILIGAQQIILRTTQGSDLDKKHIQVKKWTLTKDDMAYADIFTVFNQKCSTQELRRFRCVVGRYCIKDSDLVFYLTVRLGIVDNLLAEARVCNVPVNFLTTRGQNAKISSPVIAKTKEYGYLIQDQERLPGEVMGAFVFDPIPGFYRYPIITLDFNSLYPSTMITYNISPEKLLSDDAIVALKLKSKDVSTVNVLKKKADCQTEIQYKIGDEGFGQEYGPGLIDEDVGVDRQIKFFKGEVGIFPEILDTFLTERKNVRKGMVGDIDPLVYKLLDAKQKSLKVVANSLYGLLGASTSLFCSYDCASATTAGGRFNIIRAKNFVQDKVSGFFSSKDNFMRLLTKQNPSRALSLDKAQEHWKLVKRITAEYEYTPKIIYGDTDSIFIDMQFKEKDLALRERYKSSKVEEQQIVEITIKIGMVISDMINQLMHPKLCLAYEKIFYYFMSFKKKHYFGMLCEEDPQHATLKYSGIALVRKDYTSICKYIYRNILQHLISGKDGPQIFEEYKALVFGFLRGDHHMELSSTTKKVDENYKFPERIAQRVLADRIELREGKKLVSNTRLRYIQIYQHNVNNKKCVLQGEMIETIEFFMKKQQEQQGLMDNLEQLIKSYITFIKKHTILVVQYNDLQEENEQLINGNFSLEELCYQDLQHIKNTKSFKRVEHSAAVLHQRKRHLVLLDIFQQFACIRPAVEAAEQHQVKRGKSLVDATREEQIEELIRSYNEIVITKEYVVSQNLDSPLYYEDREIQLTMLKAYIDANKNKGLCIVNDIKSDDSEEEDSSLNQIVKILRQNTEHRREIYDMYLEIKKQWLYDNKLHCFDVELMSAIEKLFIHIFDSATFKLFLEFHDTQRNIINVKRFQIFDQIMQQTKEQCDDILRERMVERGSARGLNDEDIDDQSFINRVSYFIKMLEMRPAETVPYNEKYMMSKGKSDGENIKVGTLSRGDIKIKMIREYVAQRGSIKVKDYFLIQEAIESLVLKRLRDATKQKHLIADVEKRIREELKRIEEEEPGVYEGMTKEEIAKHKRDTKRELRARAEANDF